LLRKIPLSQEGQLLKVGDDAPDFSVTTHQGQPLSLSSLRGRKVLLWFYPMADTGG
jgi:peroxiredoxin Q/BCP